MQNSNWSQSSWKRDWTLLLFAKVLISVFLPFFSDEAYYWVWSHNLKLSYFDHPPFISWLFLLGHPLETIHFAARLPSVLMGHLTIFIWCAWIAKDFSDKEKRTLFWLLSVHTLIGFGSLVANPDIPFLFFWTLSILFFMRSIENFNSLKWPALLGCALGLGFCSKYLMVLFVPAAVIYLAVSGRWRFVKWQHFILPVFFGALFSLPVWLWNFQTDWSSFKFQLHHGLGKSWNPKWTIEFVLGTAVLLFPPFVYSFLKNRAFKQFENFNLILFLFLFCFFVYTTTGGDTELNWPLAMYPSFFFVLVSHLKIIKFYYSYLLFYGLIGLAFVSIAFINPKMNPHPRLTEGALYQKVFNQSSEYRPLYTSTYQSASYFWFLAKSPFYKLRFSSRQDEFDFMPSSMPSQETFYFLKEKYQLIPSQHLEKYAFTKIADLENNFEIYKATKNP